MTVETSPQYPSDLNASYPAAGDNIPEGDDHIRNIKTVLKTTLPNVAGAITPTHTELNYVVGVTSAIQTQLDAEAAARVAADALKAPLASPTFTGVPAAPTASVGTGTTQIATTAFVAATALVSALPGQTGNSGKIVTTDGTNASWTSAFVSSVNGSTGAVTTLTLLATLTPTAAANVDALSTFTADYDNYLIVVQGVKAATDDNLMMQLAVAGAADTGSNYYAAAFAATGTTGATSFNAGGSSVLAAGVGASLAVDVFNVNDATNIKSMATRGASQINATPGYRGIGGGCAYVAANAVTGVRFFWNGGANFAAVGKIRIYGYNNT